MLQRDFADVIKVTNQLTLRKGAIPHHPPQKKPKTKQKGINSKHEKYLTHHCWFWDIGAYVLELKKKPLEAEGGSPVNSQQGKQSPTARRNWIQSKTWISVEMYPSQTIIKNLASQYLFFQSIKSRAEKQVGSTQTPDLKNWEIINSCYFKLLNLGWFVRAATGS